MFSLFGLPRPETDRLLQETSPRPFNNKHTLARQTSSHFACNGSLPTNALPSDILCHIAQCVLSDNGIDHDTQSIIPLSHVCKHWRESIVSAGANWTRITNRREGLTALSLSRSQEAPLQIWFDMERQHPWFSDLIKHHIKKTSFLKVELTEFAELVATFPLSAQSMPELHSLEISLARLQIDAPSSDDPFTSFPPSLRSLSLCFIPLYQSFLNIKTLTKFTLHDPEFALPLDILLAFLKKNSSLKHVELDINFTDSPSSGCWAPVNNQLQYLSVTCGDVEHIQVLIHHIQLNDGGDLDITSYDNNKPGLEHILPEIHTMYPRILSSPTHMYCDNGKSIKLSGPNGSFKFYGPPTPKQDSTRLPQLSFKYIQEAHFQLHGPELPNLSLFPALRALVIDYRKDQPNTLITSLPSQAASPILKTLVFRLITFPKKFMQELIQFASRRSKSLSTKLHCIIFVGWAKDQLPTDQLHELRRHVSDIKFRVLNSEGLPKDLLSME